jgi:hypothetical protein
MQPGYNAPKPALIPEPTPWPSALALAITLFGWGLITSPVLIGIGVALFTVALAGWIGDLRHEADQD